MIKKINSLIPIILSFFLGITVLYVIFYFRTNPTAITNKNKITIATFEENREKWHGKGTLEEEHAQQGKNTLKLTSDGFNWSSQSYTFKTLNLARFDDEKLMGEMAINVFVDDASQISGIRLDLGDDPNNFYFVNQQLSDFYSSGENKVTFNAKNFKVQGQPVGWKSISWLRINLAAKNNRSTVNAWFDDWRINFVSDEDEIASQNNQKDNQKTNLLGGIMNSTIIWGIVIIVSLALGAWLIIKLLKIKRSFQVTESDHPPPKFLSREFFQRELGLKAIWIPIVLLLLFVAAICLICYNPSKTSETTGVSEIASPEASPASSQNAVSDQWEYKVLSLTVPRQTDSAIEKQLNAFGEDGWEIVSQSVHSTGKTGEYTLMYTFKKPIE